MTEKIEGKVLGKKVSAPLTYCPSILVRVPREENRTQYDIDEDNLPFVGYDIWNAYEISTLTKKGYPLFLCAKIKYDANSKYLVESKSLKLYLNSFNMEKIEGDYSKTKEKLQNVIKSDLSELLETEVEVWLYNGEEQGNPYNIYNGYTNIERVLDIDNIEFNDYNENKDLLKISTKKEKVVSVMFPMLRSNCKITHQPDWGTAFIDIIADNTVDLTSLCKYIVSFRNENHFHEECVEMIYKRLYDFLGEHNKSFHLHVAANYCRRGGIDICPIRTNTPHLADFLMGKVDVYCKKLINQ